MAKKQTYPPGTQIVVSQQLDVPYIQPTPPGSYAIDDRRFKGYGPLLVKRGLVGVTGDVPGDEAEAVTPSPDETEQE